jgi:methylglyoxal synthase
MAMQAVKRIALVAHDGKKDALIKWVKKHVETLQPHKLTATGTTGRLLSEACPQLEISLLKSGPLGGDQQIGAKIAEGEIDILIFFIDPLSPHPHEADVRALTRLSTLYHVATATNRATADFVLSSRFLNEPYSQRREDDPNST